MKLNNEKVLLIALLSEPNSLTGVHRTKGYMDFLHKFGYFPILISKNWRTPSGLNPLLIEGNETGKKYFLNLKKSISQRVNLKYNQKFTFVRKLYNLLDKLFIFFGIELLFEYKEVIKQVQSILDEHKDIRKAIVIADPFSLFYIGYKIKKKYRINWIADYRDPWNSGDHNDAAHEKVTKFARYLESKKEKKWVGSASFVTSVSDYCTQRIADFVNVPGVTIYNGFFNSDKTFLSSRKESKEKFTVFYSGTLYPEQRFEVFSQGFKQFIDQNPNANAEVLFIGAYAFDGAEQRIKEQLKGYEKHYKATDRIPKEDLLALLKKANIMLMITLGKEIKGMASSKIYEYMLSGKPILVCPSEEDVVEKLLTETGQGFFAADAAETCIYLNSFYAEFKKGNDFKIAYDEKAVMKYSRENQTKNMAALLDKI